MTIPYGIKYYQTKIESTYEYKKTKKQEGATPNQRALLPDEQKENIHTKIDRSTFGYSRSFHISSYVQDSIADLPNRWKNCYPPTTQRCRWRLMCSDLYNVILDYCIDLFKKSDQKG